MKIVFVDTPSGSIWQTDIAKYFENILSLHRKKIIDQNLFERFNITKPQHRTFTLGMLSLASTLHEHGYSVKYILADSDPELLQHINNGDVVCFSSKTTTINICIQFAEEVKKAYPATKIIFGGAHPTILPKEVAAAEPVDIVGIGEGESTLLEIIQALEHQTPLEEISGIAFYNEQGSYVETAPRPLCKCIDNLVPINYDLLPYPPKEFYIYYETRRGCSFRCSYCASHRIWQRKSRTQSAELSYRNLKKLSRSLEENTIVHIVNSSFGFDPEDLKLCRLLAKNPIGLYFSCDVCASLISEQNVRLMYDAGFRVFSAGMESASDAVLRKNHRPPFKLVKKACETIKQTCDAFIKGYWIVGLPGETEETVEETKSAISELLSENLLDLVCEHIFVPYPGCNAYDQPEKYDFVIHHNNWDFFDSRSFPLPAESVNFSMGKAYLAYLDILRMQCEYYGIPVESYSQPVSSRSLSFLEHKKHLT